MPTLTQYREEMLKIGPADMGALYPLTAAAAQSVTSSSAALGGYTNQKWKDYYLLRRDAVTPPTDRVRRVTSYVSSTGQWVHEGAAYSDTTFTGESVELWRYDPLLHVDPSINEAIRDILRLEMVELPSLNTQRHTLHAFDWMTSVPSIERIEASNSRQLSRNRFFEHYNSRASGILQPDFWTLAGAGATMARSTTQLRRGKYTLAITRAGTDATLTQTIGLLETGVSADSLRGETETAVLVGWSTEASQLRIGINDGVTTTYSSYHTGGDTFEELTVEKTLSASATKCDLIVSVETSNSIVYLDEAYQVYQTVTDSDRRASPGTTRIYPIGYEQGVSFPITLPGQGRGHSFHFYLRRPYCEFTASRIAGGTADADIADAPLTIVATGALAKMFARLAHVSQAHDEAQALHEHARVYRRSFERMAKQHLVQSGASHGAMPTFGRTWAAPARTGSFR